MLRCLAIYKPILWKIDIDYIIWKFSGFMKTEFWHSIFLRNSMKSHTSEYYIGHWVVSSELCFCKDLKNTSRLQKIWFLDPVNIKSKGPLCACGPCSTQVSCYAHPTVSSIIQQAHDVLEKPTSEATSF